MVLICRSAAEQLPEDEINPYYDSSSSSETEQSAIDTDCEIDDHYLSDSEAEIEVEEDDELESNQLESSISLETDAPLNPVSTSQRNPERSHNYISKYIIVGLLLLAYLVHANLSPKQKVNRRDEIKINFEPIERLNELYPNLLSSKQMRVIKTRLRVMRDQVSILMLLGKLRDSHCKDDPTFCIGRTIVNVTQIQSGYIDASNPQLESKELTRELGRSLEGHRHAVMVDSLEELPGSEVMNLFQFIDKDETRKRRGMLLFVVYAGSEFGRNLNSLREAEIAEKILIGRWSPYVPMDTLNSVISRISGSIVKIF